VLGDPDCRLEDGLCGVGVLCGGSGVGTDAGEELLDAHPARVAAMPASSNTLRVLETWSAIFRWARRYTSPSVRTGKRLLVRGAPGNPRGETAGLN